METNKILYNDNGKYNYNNDSDKIKKINSNMNYDNSPNNVIYNNFKNINNYTSDNDNINNINNINNKNNFKMEGEIINNNKYNNNVENNNFSNNIKLNESNYDNNNEHLMHNDYYEDEVNKYNNYPDYSNNQNYMEKNSNIYYLNKEENNIENDEINEYNNDFNDNDEVEEIAAVVQKKGNKNNSKSTPFLKEVKKKLTDNPAPIITPAIKKKIQSKLNNKINKSTNSNMETEEINVTTNDFPNNEEINNTIRKFDIINEKNIPKTNNKNVSFNDIIEIHDNISLTDTEINNKKHSNITNSKNNENLITKKKEIHNNNSPKNNILQDKDNNNIDTNKLNYLDLSVINQPNIRNAKKINKKEKIKEILSEENNNNKIAITQEFNKPEKHIKMMETFKEYKINDLIKEVASTEVITKLVYLLDLFPKFRSEFTKALRLTEGKGNNTTKANTSLINVMNIISQHKVIKVKGTVDKKPVEIFLDSCASVNLITSSALKKYNINKNPIGRISEKIFQVYSNNSIDSDIYELSITIGNYTFVDYFRKIEKDDIFDILIGVDTLKRNRFDINLVNDTLYHIDDDNNFVKLASLFYDVNLKPTDETNEGDQELDENNNDDSLSDECSDINENKLNDELDINNNDNNTFFIYVESDIPNIHINNFKDDPSCFLDVIIDNNINSNLNNIEKNNNDISNNKINNPKIITEQINKIENKNNEIIYKKINNSKINTENINNDMSKLNSHNSLKNVSERNFNDEINDPSKLLKAKINDKEYKNKLHNINTYLIPALLVITNEVIDNKDNVPINDTKTKFEMICSIINKLPEHLKSSVENLFLEYISVLALKTDDLGSSKLYPHRINLIPGTEPIKQRAYRVSKVQADALKRELIKLINNKLIVPSSSLWSSPVVLVPKKNGQVRMCVDYRKINNCTLKDAYALPLIDDILYYISGDTTILSTIDLFSGYHQIPMHPDDKDITCFTTLYGNFNFEVMPFGLCNAPATFQREMNRIFFDLIGVCVFIYIDDLVIYSSSLEQHVKDIEKVFQILNNNGLKVNFEKCHFFQEDVDLLGHTLSTKGIKPMISKIEIITNWLPPTNIKQLRSFLGAIGYYRKFISNFAQIAKPLYELTKKDTPFIWSTKCNIAFEYLKTQLVKAPILSPPNFNKPFIIRTDASKAGIGGVLLQLDDNNIEKPLYYESRTLSNAENNYSITELEGLAAFYCVKKFKPFLTGNSFETILFTDHKPLVYIFNNKEPTSSRHVRWITEFSTLKINFKYEEGKKNVVVDTLS